MPAWRLAKCETGHHDSRLDATLASASNPPDQFWASSALQPAQRAGRREHLARLQQRLDAGEHHRPAAVELVVGAFAQLVVRDLQPAESPTGSISQVTREVPSAFTSSPHSALKALHEPPRRIDLQILALEDQSFPPTPS